MNEELTREVLEALKRCNGADCHGCPAQKICRRDQRRTADRGYSEYRLLGQDI